MYFVYELVNPRTDVTGYIGITNNPNQRYREHLDGREKNSKKNKWIQRLQEQQIQPKMKILKIVDNLGQARIQERHWVKHYINEGIQLANILLIQTEVVQATYRTGGDTMTTPTISEAFSMAQRGKPPEGYYTASTARRKLGNISDGMLRTYIQRGLFPCIFGQQ